MKKEDIARVVYEQNRAYCAALGDHSFGPWEEAPDWQKGTIIDGIQFHIDNPAAGESASHDNWMQYKLADGWTYGEVKDPEHKKHPCLVAFDHLPIEQQIKDRLFRNTVHALVPLLDGSGDE